MDADELRNNTERRKGDDINFRVTKKPEQVLKQYRATARIIQLLPQRDNGRHKIAGAEQVIQTHHDGADQECRKRQQCQYGGCEDRPYGQGHSHQCHTPGTGLQNRHDIVQSTHRKTDNKNSQRNTHQGNTPTGPWRARQNCLWRIKRPARSCWPAGCEETC